MWEHRSFQPREPPSSSVTLDRGPLLSEPAGGLSLTFTWPCRGSGQRGRVLRGQIWNPGSSTPSPVAWRVTSLSVPWRPHPSNSRDHRPFSQGFMRLNHVHMLGTLGRHVTEAETPPTKRPAFTKVLRPCGVLGMENKSKGTESRSCDAYSPAREVEVTVTVTNVH